MFPLVMFVIFWTCPCEKVLLCVVIRNSRNSWCQGVTSCIFNFDDSGLLAVVSTGLLRNHLCYIRERNEKRRLRNFTKSDYGLPAVVAIGLCVSAQITHCCLMFLCWHGLIMWFCWSWASILAIKLFYLAGLVYLLVSCVNFPSVGIRTCVDMA